MSLNLQTIRIKGINRAEKKEREILGRCIAVLRRVIRTSRIQCLGRDLREVREQGVQIFGRKVAQGKRTASAVALGSSRVFQMFEQQPRSQCAWSKVSRVSEEENSRR